MAALSLSVWVIQGAASGTVVNPAGVVRDELMQTHVYSKSSMPTDAPALTLGVVFSGGPAPGGHDVLCGMLSHLRPEDTLIGFCNGPEDCFGLSIRC